MTRVDDLNTEPEIPLVADPGFSLVDFLRVLRLRRKIILGTALVVVALTAAIVLQLTPRYSAKAVVMLDQRKHTLEDTTAVLSGLPTDPAAVQNQVQILTSLDLADHVVTKLHLDGDPDFSPRQGRGWTSVFSVLNPLNWFSSSSKTQAEAQGIDPRRSAVIHNFLGHLSVNPIGLSTAIEVKYEMESPKKAADIANAIAQAYVEDQLEAKYKATQEATKYLSARVAELAQKVQEADEAVQRYKVAHGITTTPEGGSVVDQQIKDINAQLLVARADLAEKRAAYERLSALARSGRAANAGQVLSSVVIANLRAQEATLTNQIANMSSKYLPQHPKMLDLQAQKKNLDDRINEEIQRIVDAAKNDVDVASAHVGSLDESLKIAAKNVAGQNEAEVQLNALQSAAKSAHTMYDTMLGQLNQTQGQEGIQSADARIISTAEVPQNPSFPKKGMIIGLSVPAGLILGLLVAFIVERLDSGFRTAAEVEQALGIPVLSTIPEVEGISIRDKTWVKAADQIVDRPTSAYAEAVRGLQLGLTLSNVDRQPQVVVVTSSVPGEGKTTLAISLARMAARSGVTTVLVDCDLRRPSIARIIGYKDLANGIIEALTEMAPLDQCLAPDLRTNAWVLPCVHPSPNPVEALASEAMHRLVNNLRRVFDLVIIDSAPLLPVNDTKVVSRLADAVLMVVRWQSTPRDAVANTLRSLLDVRANVAGVALARADYERFRYYSYGYQNYVSYSKYYHD